jgi:DNA invertase Pin-like site-specific DNA recombinase
MKYGYARVSTEDQNPALQLAALKRAGCQKVFKDLMWPTSRILCCGYHASAV